MKVIKNLPLMLLLIITLQNLLLQTTFGQAQKSLATSNSQTGQESPNPNVHKGVPDKQIILFSPDKKHSLIVKEYFHAGTASFYIKDRVTKQVRALDLEGTYNKALWSLDSKYLACNQHIVSNFNNCMVYSVKTASFIDLKGSFDKFAPKADQEIVNNHDHLAVDAKKWLNSTTLIVQITGHGIINPNANTDGEFTLIYHVDLTTLSFQRIAYFPKEKP